MKHPTRLSIGIVLTASATVATAGPVVDIVYETGPAYIAQNDGRYGEAGTAFEADDVGQRDNLLRAQRASVEVVSGRHRAIALYAPFEVATRVSLEEPLVFRETTFDAGDVVDHRYRFNGYRASYLYLVVTGPVDVEVGGSLQIRDADVAFSSADGLRYDNQSDIGVVPAAKLRVTYAPGLVWAALEADALSTFGLVGDTSGALYDLGLSAGFPVRRNLNVFANVRLLGGGADVPAQQIDNWANYVSGSLGVRLRLGD